MKVRLCDICKKEAEMFFKCKIKHNTLSFDYGTAFDETMWFKAEICEDCLKRIIDEVNK